MHKELLKLNSKKATWLKKRAKDLNRQHMGENTDGKEAHEKPLPVRDMS